MSSPVKVWRNQKKISSLIGKEGTVLTWSVVRVPPEGYSAFAPYVIGVVRTSDGIRLTCPVVDCDLAGITKDMKVRLVLRRMGEPEADGVIVYGIKAIPEE